MAEFFRGPMWELLQESFRQLSESEKQRLLTCKTWEDSLEIRSRAKQLDTLTTDVFKDFAIKVARTSGGNDG